MNFYNLTLAIIIILLANTYSMEANDLSNSKYNSKEWITYSKSLQRNNPDSTFSTISKEVLELNSKGKYFVAWGLVNDLKSGFDSTSKYHRNFKQFEIRLKRIILQNIFNPQYISFIDPFIESLKNTKDNYIGFRRKYEMYINNVNYENAIKIINAHKDKFPDKLNFLNELIDILSRPKSNVIVRNLSKSINTVSNEWGPNLSADGSKLFFTSNRSGSFGGADIWQANLIDGKWRNILNLGKIVNNKNNETIDNVSLDGTTLLLSGNFPGTFGKFDIYTISKDSSNWTSMKHLPMPVNSIYNDEGANISADGNILIFTSDRPGGIGRYIPFGQFDDWSTHGNMDLYISKKVNGKWTKPINLGNTLNTPKSERSPFLHSDGKTLYFSSNGHPGLGQLDVFKTTRLDDTWLNWSKPVNLGKEINTIADDWEYNITPTGDSAIFSARNRMVGQGGLDIYSVSLPDESKPLEVVTITGKVIDENGTPVYSDVIWENLNTGKLIGKIKSNPNFGNYFIVLPIGEFYGYYASKTNYISQSNNLDLRNVKAGSTLNIDIVLSKIDRLKNDQKAFVINNLFFDFDSYKLLKESFNELDRIATFINQNKISQIKIIGHTDDKGTKEYNINLSLNRAKAVSNYLVKKCPKLIIKIEGMGDTEPKFTPSNETNRSKNRRVEIFFK